MHPDKVYDKSRRQIDGDEKIPGEREWQEKKSDITE